MPVALECDGRRVDVHRAGCGVGAEAQAAHGEGTRARLVGGFRAALRRVGVAFIGIHIPLIGLLFFAIYDRSNVGPQTILIFTLVMTLVATGITLAVLKWLIKPIEIASKA